MGGLSPFHAHPPVRQSRNRTLLTFRYPLLNHHPRSKTLHQPPFASSLQPLFLARLPTRQHERHLLHFQLLQTNFAISKATAMLDQGRLTDAAACTNCASLYQAQSAHTLNHLSQHASGQNRQNAEETQAATAELVNLVAAAATRSHLPASQLNRATQQHHAILSAELLQHLHTILSSHDSTQDPCHTQSLMTFASVVANNPDVIPEPHPPATSDTLEHAAQEARATAAHTYHRMAALYSPTLSYRTSPRITAVPALAEKLQEELIGPNDALVGIYHNPDTTSDLDEALQELSTLSGDARLRALADTYRRALCGNWIVPFILFAHESTRHAKHVLDPYPRAYPHSQAVAHMALLSATPHSLPADAPSPSLSAELSQLMLKTANEALSDKLHTLAPEDLQLLMTTAAQNDLPPAATMLTLSTVAAGNTDLVSVLLNDHERNWQRIATPHQTHRLIAYARSIGIDEFAAIMLANTLGYHTKDLGALRPRISPEASDNLNMALRFTPIPEPTIQFLNTLL